MTDSISVTKSEFLEKRDSFVVEDCHLGDVNNALKLVSRLLQEADPTLGETGQLSTLENIRTELMTFMELFHVAGSQHLETGRTEDLSQVANILGQVGLRICPR